MKSQGACFIFLISLGFLSCNQNAGETRKLKADIDSLKAELAAGYKPGLGEFMSNIQLHHAKLWFAGENENWELADFEIHEIEEALEDIKTFNPGRVEIKNIGMILPAMDSVTNSISGQNAEAFKNSFILLTKTCNDCHKATEHPFNVVTIPTALPVVNQDFRKPH